jgi:hypothetical protein
VALFSCTIKKKKVKCTDYESYLVQQYDKEYRLWARDLKTQMEMTAWVRILERIEGSRSLAHVSSEWTLSDARSLANFRGHPLKIRPSRVLFILQCRAITECDFPLYK